MWYSSSEEDKRRLILTNTMVWCPCYKPVFNNQLLLHQPPLRTAPCWLQMALVAQCGGCGGRAAAWAATEIHLGCFQTHSTCWCCIILFSGAMLKWMLFIISTPPIIKKFKLKARKCWLSDCVFAFMNQSGKIPTILLSQHDMLWNCRSSSVQ